MTEQEAKYWISRWPGGVPIKEIPPSLQGYLKEPVEDKKLMVLERIWSYVKYKVYEEKGQDKG